MFRYFINTLSKFLFYGLSLRRLIRVNNRLQKKKNIKVLNHTIRTILVFKTRNNTISKWPMQQLNSFSGCITSCASLLNPHALHIHLFNSRRKNWLPFNDTEHHWLFALGLHPYHKKVLWFLQRENLTAPWHVDALRMHLLLVNQSRSFLTPNATILPIDEVMKIEMVYKNVIKNIPTNFMTYRF